MNTPLICLAIILWACAFSGCACRRSDVAHHADQTQRALLIGLASQSERPTGTDLYAVLDKSWDADAVLEALWDLGHLDGTTERRWSLLVLTDIILGLVPINEPLGVSSREVDSSIDHFLIQRYETETDAGRKCFAAALLRHRKSHVATEYCVKMRVPDLGETMPVVDRDYAFLKTDAKH